MPKPKTGEQKKDFINRCVGVLIKEGKSTEQSVAECYGLWDEKLDDNILRTYQKIYKKIEQNGKK